jgi:hypothetical protein
MLRRRRIVPGIALAFFISTLAMPNAAAGKANPSGRSCTSEWTEVPAPAPYTDELTDVSAVSVNDVWAVGASGYVSSVGLIEHWDGTTWTAVPFQRVGTNTAFFGVSATAADDAWAVGYVIKHGGYTYPLVEHWNGTKWSAMTTPAGGILYAVVAKSRTDVWALGEQNGFLPFIEHWDGVSWKIVSSPPPPSGGNFYHGASIPSGLWGVGYQDSGRKALAERWDGSQWTVVSTANVADSSFRGADALGDTDAWAVGFIFELNPTQPLAEHGTDPLGPRSESTPSPARPGSAASP